MKRKEKEQAIFLRKEKGMSLREISNELGVAKSTVSYWVRDIELSEEFKERLAYKNRAKAGILHSENFRNKRRDYQKQGRELANNADSMFAFYCAIYAGEGSKFKNAVQLSNTDPFIIKGFFDFINNNFEVTSDEWTVYINCYSGGRFPVEDIESYWIDLLGLEKKSLRKTHLKNGTYDGKNKDKYPYGVCRIVLGRTDIQQKLFGAIKEFLVDKSERWLD